MAVRRARAIVVSLLVGLLLAPPLLAGRGAAARTRPSAGAAPRGVAHRSGERPGGAPVTATGKATYGYHHGVHYPYGYYPYYPFVGYYPYFSFYYWSYPWWWYPYYYDGVSPYGHAVYVYGGERSAPAAVETDVSPKRAVVRLDGEEVGLAKDYNGRWDRLWVAPGEHVIEFEAEGHRSLRVAFQARPGAVHRFSYELQTGDGVDPRSVTRPEERDLEVPVEGPQAPAERPQLARGFLRLEIRPDDAAVYLDGEFLASGKELARLHGAIPVAAGEHRVEVVKPGHLTWAKTVTVDPGEPTVLAVELEPQSR